MYKLFYNENDARPWYVAVTVLHPSGDVAFYQQVSPNYVHRGSALRWCARNMKMLYEETW